jgi:hypothetical protein
MSTIKQNSMRPTSLKESFKFNYYCDENFEQVKNQRFKKKIRQNVKKMKSLETEYSNQPLQALNTDPGYQYILKNITVDRLVKQSLYLIFISWWFSLSPWLILTHMTFSFYTYMPRLPIGLHNEPVMNFFIKLAEDVLLFMNDIFKAEENSGRIKALIHFLKHRLGDRPLLDCRIFKTMLGFLKDWPSTHTLQSGELETARDLLNKLNEARHSKITQKCTRMFKYILSFSILEKVGIDFESCNYTKFEAAAVRKEIKGSKVDIIYELCDFILFICERGYQYVKTGEFTTIFHSGEKYSVWYDSVMLLKRQYLLLNEPELHGFSEFDFIARLDRVIEDGDAMYKYSKSMKDSDAGKIGALLNELKLMKAMRFTKTRARETRRPPFSVLLFGNSSIGKSSILDMLYQQFCKIKKLPNTPDFKFVWNPAANFPDGFSTKMHTCVFDDIAFMHPNKASQGDPSLMTVIQAINGMPFVPDQAALEDKGKIPFRCEFVVGTTNTKNLNAHYYFSAPTAVRRRFPFIIEPIVKEEYCTDNVLDSSKVPQSGSYPDLWTWNVTKVAPGPVRGMGTDTTRLLPVLENASLKEMLMWFNSAVAIFDKNQDSMVASIERMVNADLCDHMLPVDVCGCRDHIQSGIFGTTYSYFASFLFTVFMSAVFFKLYRSIRLVRFVWNRYSYRLLKYICRHQYAQIKEKLDKYTFIKIGDNVKIHIGYPILLTGIVTVVFWFLKFYKLKDTLQSDDKALVLQEDDKPPENRSPSNDAAPNDDKTESVALNFGRAPVAEEERKNIWFKDNYEITSFDVSCQTTGMKALSKTEIRNIFLRNCYTILFTFKNKYGISSQTRTRVIAIRGSTFIINAHAVPDCEEFQIDITSQNMCDGVNSNIQMLGTKRMFTQLANLDVSYFRVAGLPPHKDIRHYFAKSTLNGTFDGEYLRREKSSEIQSVEAIKLIKYDHVNLKGTCLVWRGHIRSPTKNGDCGSMLVTYSEYGPIILGFHIAMNESGTQSYAIRIPEEYLMALPEDLVLQHGTPIWEDTKYNHVLGDLDKKSPFRYIEEGDAKVYGSIIGFRSRPKTRVQKSIMNEWLSCEGYKTKYTKPVMTGWLTKHIAIRPALLRNNRVKQHILESCVQNFILDLKSSISKENFEKNLFTYDDFTTINGAAGVMFVDKINRNTSAGFPWRKSKKFFLKAIPPRGANQDPVEVDEEILVRSKIIIDKYIAGERACPIFTASLKDEAVTFAKAKQEKTRVFMGAPFDWSIVVRKFLLSHVRFIQKNSYCFEAAPGMNCHSKQWHKLYNYLTKFGKDSIVNGDYKNYDKGMLPDIIIASFKILVWMAEYSGNFTKQEIDVIRGIATDVAYPHLDFFGDLVQLFGCEPSGHPLTVIINCLANSLLMRYAYMELNPDKECKTFKQNVSLMTYGDDNIMGVHKNVHSWFNHCEVVRAFLNIDVIYTMADKEAVSVPFVHIDQASFLKRTFRYDDDLKHFVAPLEHDSIEKSLMVWVKSKTINSKEQAMAIVTSTVREYFWYGREIFHQKTELFKRMVKALELDFYVVESSFPTWDQLSEEYNRE